MRIKIIMKIRSPTTSISNESNVGLRESFVSLKTIRSEDIGTPVGAVA
jgi:hypothetical protein